jgi:streptomycin 6-kinase
LTPGRSHTRAIPELIELIPLELYQRGRQLAMQLVEHVSPTALLHGDLTPSNILDGGNQRGVVAIDPAHASATTWHSTRSTFCSGRRTTSTRSQGAPSTWLGPSR